MSSRTIFCLVGIGAIVAAVCWSGREARPLPVRPVRYVALSPIDGRPVTFDEYVRDQRVLSAYAQAVADEMEARR